MTILNSTHAPTFAAPTFAADEIGWLGDEAQRLRLRVARDSSAPRLDDAHRVEPAFALLANHPRLVERARRALGGDVVLVASELRFGTAPSPALPAGFARAIVDLGPAPEGPRRPGRLGAVAVAAANEVIDADGRIAFVGVYRRQRGSDPALALADDDSLWPSAAFCAG